MNSESSKNLKRAISKPLIQALHFVEDKTEEIKEKLSGEHKNKTDVLKSGTEKESIESEIQPEEIKASTRAKLCG